MNWTEIIEEYREDGHFLNLTKFLVDELNNKKVIYPTEDNWFRAFLLTPYDAVKVVIVGQDPYHEIGIIAGDESSIFGPQAHGLAFSTPTMQIPPSLKNIYKELESDMNVDRPRHGDLTEWATQGVLLLNTVLTVEDGKPGSHADKGWEGFTSAMIDKLVMNRDNIVFILWGAKAQEMEEIINARPEAHLILKAPHPSPNSAHKGFFGCKHFSAANKYLAKNGINPIDWSLE